MATAWVTLTNTELALDKPWTFPLARKARDREEHLFEAAMRCGTFAAPKRLVFARGSFTFNITMSAGQGQLIQNVTFSTAATDGNPAFSAKPFPFFAFEEDGTGFNWLSEDVRIAVFTDSSLTSTGMDVKIQALTNSASPGNCKGTCYWYAVGLPTAGQ